jgi:hypothetical protein
MIWIFIPPVRSVRTTRLIQHAYESFLPVVNRNARGAAVVPKYQ